MTPSAIMLFAAGFGTRMQPLTNERPKPLIKVAGKTLLDHALDQIDAFGPARIVINLHYKPDQIRAHLAGRDVDFSLETPNILETGGGLRHALPRLGDGPVFTMNTDMVWAGANPLMQLAQAWDPDCMDALLLCVPRSRATGYTGRGNFDVSPDGSAMRGTNMVYTGVQIVKPEGLHDISETAFSLNVLWDRMLAAGRLHAVTYTGHWCDVGTPAGISLAETMLEAANV